MSAEILVAPAELREHSNAVQSQAQQTLEQFEALRGRLQALADQFRGRAAARFDEQYEQWNTGATDLMNALDSLGMFLSNAAETVEQADEQLASNLGG